MKKNVIFSLYVCCVVALVGNGILFPMLILTNNKIARNERTIANINAFHRYCNEFDSTPEAINLKQQLIDEFRKSIKNPYSSGIDWAALFWNDEDGTYENARVRYALDKLGLNEPPDGSIKELESEILKLEQLKHRLQWTLYVFNVVIIGMFALIYGCNKITSSVSS